MIDRIFTPFGGVNHRGEVLGNGVGLSICKQICEQLDGSIKVESTVGAGSMFRFSMKCFAQDEIKESASLKKISE